MFSANFCEMAFCDSLRLSAMPALLLRSLKSQSARNSWYYTRNLILLPRWEEARRVEDKGQLRGNMDKCSDKWI
jgi:hypothetical protein